MRVFFSSLLILTTWINALSETILVPEETTTIQAGIDKASEGDTILVSDGIYNEYHLNFGGKNLKLISKTGPQNTTIDAGSHGSVFLFIGGEDTTSHVSGFTIAGGYGYPDGGGIYCHSSSPKLSNLIITECKAEEHGGGIYLLLSNPVLQSVVILNNQLVTNSAVEYGGGIYMSNSTVKLDSVEIRGNVAERGGGIHLNWSRLFLKNSQIVKNIETGIDTENSYVELTDCEIVDNANKQTSIGGYVGIYSRSRDTVILERVVIAGHNAHAIYSDWNSRSIFELDQTTIVNNQEHTNIPFSSGEVCAIYLRGGSQMNITNSILWDNGSSHIFADASTSLSISRSDIRLGLQKIISEEGAQINWLEGNIDRNPFFRNSLAGDYSLAGNSPCIGSGENGVTMGAIGQGRSSYTEKSIWYVSNTGSDSTGNGSFESPFEHIGFALSVANDRDSVIVSQGTYPENITFPDCNITLGSLHLLDGNRDHIQETVIDGGGNGSVLRLFWGYDSLSHVDGFTITNGSGYLYDGLPHGGGIQMVSSKAKLSNLRIIGNQIPKKNGRGAGLGIVNSQSRIENVEIYSNTSLQYCWGGGIYSNNSDLEIINALIYNNEALNGDALYSREDSKTELVNSTLVGNDICFYYSSLKTINTIFWETGNYGNINFSGSADDTLFIDYSCIEKGRDNISTTDGIIVWGENNMTQDPHFVNAEEHDYSLNTGSPLIDVGSPEAENLILPFFDLNGNKRIIDGNGDGNSLVDIGAYEYKYNNPPSIVSDFPVVILEEDKPKSIHINEWFPYVQDEESHDSLLSWNFNSSSHVIIQQNEDSILFLSDLNWFGFDTTSVEIDDGTKTVQASLYLHVLPINDPSILSNIETTKAFFGRGSEIPTQLTSTISISDIDDDSLQCADIKFSEGYLAGEDSLYLKEASVIIPHWDATTGVLSLSGHTSLTEYESALRNVLYFNTAGDATLSNKTISLTVFDSESSNEVYRVLTIVEKSDQTISFDELPLRIYGDEPFSLTASASSGLSINYASSNPEVANVAGEIVHLTGSGSTMITASQPGNEAYNAATDIDRTLTVSKAELLVNADHKTKLQGEMNPEFTMSFEGFVLNEDESVLDMLPVAICNVDQSSPPGEYPISVSGGDDNNYSFSYQDGILTIEPITNAVASLEKGLSVYPNPAHENVIINSSGEDMIQTVRIIDSHGSEVFFKSIMSNSAYLDCSMISNGMYILLIETASQFVPMRIQIL